MGTNKPKKEDAHTGVSAGKWSYYDPDIHGPQQPQPSAKSAEVQPTVTPEAKPSAPGVVAPLDNATKPEVSST